MNTYETHIMPQKCFVYAQFCNGKFIDTSINPEISNEDIFDHYLGRTFTFAQFDEKDNEIEIKTKCIRLLITREEQPESMNVDQLALPPSGSTTG